MIEFKSTVGRTGIYACGEHGCQEQRIALFLSVECSAKQEAIAGNCSQEFPASSVQGRLQSARNSGNFIRINGKIADNSVYFTRTGTTTQAGAASLFVKKGDTISISGQQQIMARWYNSRPYLIKAKP